MTEDAFVGRVIIIVGALVVLVVAALHGEATNTLILMLVGGLVYGVVKAAKHFDRQKITDATPSPKSTPQSANAPISSEIATQRVFDLISEYVPDEPWHSLFHDVVTELVTAEQIFSNSSDLHIKRIADTLVELAKEIPKATPSPLHAPFHTRLKDAQKTIEGIIWAIIYYVYGDPPPNTPPWAFDDYRAPCLSKPRLVVWPRVWKGKYETKKYEWEGQRGEGTKEIYEPVGPNPEAYLDGTPYERILRYPVPLFYTPEKRFEHTQIVGGSGAGKTTLLSHLMLYDLKQPEPPCVILIDPKRIAIDKLSRLKLLKSDPLIISPRYQPSINVFAPSRNTNGAIETLCYLFGQLGNDLTSKMRTPFEYVARLLTVFPQTMGRNATLLDLYDLMVEKFPEKYRPAVSGLRETQRRFFEQPKSGFESREYRDTKEQIRTRLDRLLANEHLDSIFTSQENKIDIFEEMQKGTTILVDTAEDLLGPENHKLFGCIFISLVMQAIYDRIAIREEERKPAFMYVDEAQFFFSSSIQSFLTEARQQKVGGIFSYHDISQTSDELQQGLQASTATKIVSPKVTTTTARVFAPYLRWEWEAVRNQPLYHFACSIEGVQDTAVSITAPPGQLEKEDKIGDAEYEQLLQRNRRRISAEQRRQEQPHAERQEQERSAPPPPPGAEKKTRTGPKPTWTEQDELALADALHQLAVAMRRKDAARAAELRQIIAEAEARKAAAEEETADEKEWRL